MRSAALIAVLFGLVAASIAEVYFTEDFNDGWESRWVKSTHKGSEAGDFDAVSGKYYADANDKGLHTKQDARFYQISAKIPKSFSNKGKDLVFQFSVKHEQNIDCGGGYFKLLPGPLDQTKFNGDSKYHIMFGPDICGSSTKKTHVILNYKGENKLIKKEVKAESDQYSHVYTLILHPDNTYEVKLDGASVQKGNLKDDWDFLLPREINDPAAKKPEDWVDEKTIADPTDVKPEGWDDIPKEIADPDAKKPEDWDDELDGSWEAPTINNPEYKGEWKPRQIENPAYKGEWVHPKIANPDFVDDDEIYAFDDFSYVGLEVWQVKAGTIFDHIIVTDDVAEAEKLVPITNNAREAEKKAFEKEEAEKRAKEEEERKKKEAEEKTEEEEEEPAEDLKDEL
jgi:calreticulin